jgi:Peptidase family M41
MERCLVQLVPRENPYLNGPGGYRGSRPFSEDTAEVIDAEMLKIINESHEEAKRLLTVHRKQLDALAEALVARETLNEQEILDVTGLPPAPPSIPGCCPLLMGTAGALAPPREHVDAANLLPRHSRNQSRDENFTTKVAKNTKFRN